MTTVHINATTETINVALKGHQIALEDWDFQSFSADLHAWAERIILDFKFEIGIPALKIEPLRRRYGHYMRGRNGFGLIDEVAIDKCHVQDSSYWRVIGTLCHELIHAWQEHNATPPSPKSHNYHNREFREKAESIGLIVNQSGFTQYTPGDTPFFRLLKKCGMTVPELPQLQPAQPRPSRSTLQLYECPCGVKVRVGRSRFNARCLDCGGVFKKNL